MNYNAEETVPEMIAEQIVLTGLASLDNQHAKINNIIAKLVNAIEMLLSRNEIILLFEDAEALVVVHNTMEERLMKVHNYPYKDKHICEHKIICKNIGILKRSFLMHGHLDKLVKIMSNQVKDWHNEHIVKFDLPLASFLQQQNAK